MYPFEEDSFDVVISRFGVMLFIDPAVAYANMRRLLVSWLPVGGYR